MGRNDLMALLSAKPVEGEYWHEPDLQHSRSVGLSAARLLTLMREGQFCGALQTRFSGPGKGKSLPHAGVRSAEASAIESCLSWNRRSGYDLNYWGDEIASPGLDCLDEFTSQRPEMEAVMGKISLIGLGTMGGVLARTLQNAGHTITVCNRSADKMRPFVANGATGANSIDEAVAASPVILVCIDSYATTRRLLGSEDVVSHLSGRTLVQFSTGTPREAQESADWCNQHSVTYIDGAIECLPTGVGTAGAQFLFAGPEAAYREIDPLLACLGGDRRYLGENIRAPTTLDLAWLSQRLGQMIGALHAVGLCESENVGVDALEAMLPEGDRARILVSRIRRDHYIEPDATVGVWDAVSRRLNDQAQDRGINAEFPGFAASIVRRAMRAGYGDEDVAALVKVFRER
jgi:3-hydroxyisobutyrate dehydrogenase-like beta-hydroxyacid dehydrogenase